MRDRIDAAGIHEDAFTSQVIEFFTQLQSRKDQLLKLNLENNALVIPPLRQPKWIEAADIYSKKIADLIVKYEEDAKNDNRDEIKKKLNCLQANKWLSEHRLIIHEEVERLKLINQLQEARRMTNTKALSQKKGELAVQLITDANIRGKKGLQKYSQSAIFLTWNMRFN